MQYTPNGGQDAAQVEDSSREYPDRAGSAQRSRRVAFHQSLPVTGSGDEVADRDTSRTEAGGNARGSDAVRSSLRVDIATLPSVPVSNRGMLPPVSAVYFGLSETNEILYIGQAVLLRARWRSHRALSQGVTRIAWLPCRVNKLSTWERRLIRHYHPVLNIVMYSLADTPRGRKGSFAVDYPLDRAIPHVVRGPSDQCLLLHQYIPLSEFEGDVDVSSMKVYTGECARDHPTHVDLVRRPSGPRKRLPA